MNDNADYSNEEADDSDDYQKENGDDDHLSFYSSHGAREQTVDLSSSDQQRIIIHVDLDAFYAQVEALRHPHLAHRPIAVQQWNSLIAVGYSARKFGVTRFLSVAEALKVYIYIYIYIFLCELLGSF